MTLALFCACNQTRHRSTPYSFSSSARPPPDTQPTYGRDNGLRPLRGSSCRSRAGGVIAGPGNHTQSLLRPPSVGNTLLCTRFVHPIPQRRAHRRHTGAPHQHLATPPACPRRPLEPHPEGRPRPGGLGATEAFSEAGWWDVPTAHATGPGRPGGPDDMVTGQRVPVPRVPGRPVVRLGALGHLGARATARRGLDGAAGACVGKTSPRHGPGRPGPVPPAAGRLPRLIQAPRFATAPADPYAGRRCHAGVGRRQPGDAPVRHRSRGLRPPRTAMRRAYGPGRAEVRR